MEISDLKSANMHLTRYYTLHTCCSLDCKTAGGQTLRSDKNCQGNNYLLRSKVLLAVLQPLEPQGCKVCHLKVPAAFQWYI